MTMSATRRKHVASLRLLPPNLCIFQGLPDTVLFALDRHKAANDSGRLMRRLCFLAESSFTRKTACRENLFNWMRIAQ